MQNLFHKICTLWLRNYDVGKDLVFAIIVNGYVPYQVTTTDGHQSDSTDRALKIDYV